MNAAPKLEPWTEDDARAKSLTADHGCRPVHASLLGAEYCPFCEGHLEHVVGCLMPLDEMVAVDARFAAIRAEQEEARARWAAENAERMRWAACSRHNYGPKRRPRETCASCGAPRGHR